MGGYVYLFVQYVRWYSGGVFRLQIQQFSGQVFIWTGAFYRQQLSFQCAQVVRFTMFSSLDGCVSLSYMGAVVLQRRVGTQVSVMRTSFCFMKRYQSFRWESQAQFVSQSLLRQYSFRMLCVWYGSTYTCVAFFRIQFSFCSQEFGEYLQCRLFFKQFAGYTYEQLFLLLIQVVRAWQLLSFGLAYSFTSMQSSSGVWRKSLRQTYVQEFSVFTQLLLAEQLWVLGVVYSFRFTYVKSSLVKSFWQEYVVVVSFFKQVVLL